MLGFGAIGQFAIGEVGFGGEVVTVDKWFVPLSEPVRFLPGMAPSRQQFAALSDPFPFVSFSWFEELSIPSKRTLPGLGPSAQQFIAFHPAPSPFVATGWFEALSEPARTLPGLPPSRQQFFAAPPQLRPNPNLSAVLSAVETKDIMLAGMTEWSRVTSGEVGIIESGSPSAEIGASVQAITSAQISIRII